MREKYWTKEFDALLATLRPLMGGVIKEIADVNPDMARAIPSSVFLYPSLIAEIEGRRVEFTLCDIPASRMLDVSGPVDEYFHFIVACDVSAEFIVTVEGAFTRLRKFLRIDRDFETGNSTFDQRYYLDPRSELARAKLTDSSIQTTIRHLEPFTIVHAREGSVFLSRGAEDAADFSAELVQKTFAELVALSKLLT